MISFSFLHVQCRETYWIESFHTAMLIYVSKRIHYGDDTYNMRVELAVLDWVRKKQSLNLANQLIL